MWQRSGPPTTPTVTIEFVGGPMDGLRRQVEGQPRPLYEFELTTVAGVAAGWVEVAVASWDAEGSAEPRHPAPRVRYLRGMPGADGAYRYRLEGMGW